MTSPASGLAEIQSMNASRSASFHPALALLLELSGFDDSLHHLLYTHLNVDRKLNESSVTSILPVTSLCPSTFGGKGIAVVFPDSVKFRFI
jgi:hypothetical protein